MRPFQQGQAQQAGPFGPVGAKAPGGNGGGLPRGAAPSLAQQVGMLQQGYAPVAPTMPAAYQDLPQPPQATKLVLPTKQWVQVSTDRPTLLRPVTPLDRPVWFSPGVQPQDAPLSAGELYSQTAAYRSGSGGACYLPGRGTWWVYVSESWTSTVTFIREDAADGTNAALWLHGRAEPGYVSSGAELPLRSALAIPIWIPAVTPVFAAYPKVLEVGAHVDVAAGSPVAGGWQYVWVANGASPSVGSDMITVPDDYGPVRFEGSAIPMRELWARSLSLTTPVRVRMWATY